MNVLLLIYLSSIFAGSPLHRFLTNSQKVINGRPSSDLDAFESMIVFLNGRDEDRKVASECSGVVIDGCVLTAAHCIKSDYPSLRRKKKISIHRGRDALTTDPDGIQAAYFQSHPDYDKRNLRLEHDLAIVRPEALIAKEDSLSSATAFASRVPVPGEKIFFGGYGETVPGKRDTGLRHLGFNTIEGVYSTPFLLRQFFSSSAKGEKEGSIGVADSGGPGFLKDGGHNVIVGITSANRDKVIFKGAPKNYFAPLYLESNLTWVQKTLKEMGCGDWEKDTGTQIVSLLKSNVFQDNGSWAKRDEVTQKLEAALRVHLGMREHFAYFKVSKKNAKGTAQEITVYAAKPGAKSSKAIATVSLFSKDRLVVSELF